MAKVTKKVVVHMELTKAEATALATLIGTVSLRNIKSFACDEEQYSLIQGIWCELDALEP